MNKINMEMVLPTEALAAFGSLALSLISNIEDGDLVLKLVEQYAEFEYDLLAGVGSVHPKSRDEVIRSTVENGLAFVAQCRRETKARLAETKGGH